MKNEKNGQNYNSKPGGIFGIVFTVIFSILLSITNLLFPVILFFHAVSANRSLPGAGGISSEWMTDFLGSWYSILLSIIFLILPFLILLLININYIRRIFLSAGISFVFSGVCIAVLGISSFAVQNALPAIWRDALLNTDKLFKDFMTICSMHLLLSGAVCISIYFCISIVKGDYYEEAF